MSTTKKPLNQWQKKAQEYRDSVKFFPKNRQLAIYPEYEPTPKEIDGKFGKRTMYIIHTDIGLVAVTAQQLTDINTRLDMRGNYTEPLMFP